jgi:hypothetical protein
MKMPDLIFKEVSTVFGAGQQATVFFPNGFGVSILRGGDLTFDWEIAVLKGNSEHWELWGEKVTETNDEEDVKNILSLVESLR